jgi:uncharacterized protein involved in exopolysaccharide biosynthesis
MNDSTHANPADDRLAGRDFFAILWRGRIALLGITLTITAAAAIGSYLTPVKYDATVLLMPVTDMDAPERGGGGAAGAALGGLASLAGLSAGGNTLKLEALAMLESEVLTDRFIQENNLLPVLYRERWDAANGRWKSGQVVPTLWKANRFFRGIRTVVDNPRTGLVQMTIRWRDARQAASWANDLVAMTNEYLRKRAVDEAERNIAFLQDQQTRSNIVAVQQAIASLTEAQLKKVMLAQTRDQYALKVLDPATVPERQSIPRPLLWTVSAFFGGLFLAVLLVLLRASGDASPSRPRTVASRAGQLA